MYSVHLGCEQRLCRYYSKSKKNGRGYYLSASFFHRHLSADGGYDLSTSFFPCLQCHVCTFLTVVLSPETRPKSTPLYTLVYTCLSRQCAEKKRKEKKRKEKKRKEKKRNNLLLAHNLLLCFSSFVCNPF